MSYYSRGMVVGAEAPSQFDLWREQARKFAREHPQRRFAGMGFRGDGTSTQHLSSEEKDTADWYGEVVEEPNMAYAVYFDNGKMAEQFIGQVKVTVPRKNSSTGLVLLITGGMLGLATFVSKRKRG